MSNKSASDIISTPTGGGALQGMGEKFSPDLHTGTGNFTVPIAIPPGRNGFRPHLNLVYSTGNGNGPFGLGWSLGIPGVCRKTTKGIPIYDDEKDVFILSGAEDLVPVEKMGNVIQYRPRTEGLFANIFHHRDATENYWEVFSKDGLKSIYGSKASLATDRAVVAQPTDRSTIFHWNLTRTEDTFGNRIEYDYQHDGGEDGPHRWDQVYLNTIRYVDYAENPLNPLYLVVIEFMYESRPDPHSGYRSGFEIRTRKRCAKINVRINAGKDLIVRTYDLTYLDERPELTRLLPLNGVSLLSQISVTGHDGEKTETMPPLEFRYTNFEPGKRDFFPLQGSELPSHSLAHPTLELVDLFGSGLPDFVEMNGAVRYWRNLGGGRFDLPRFMNDAPGGITLADPGVQFMDANGNGRTDLLVTNAVMSGYFPLNFSGQWDRNSFQRYRLAPSFNVKDPEVKLLDLDGDGVTDAIRSGTRLECFFNDPEEGWNSTRWMERQALSIFPDVHFSDERVKWADLTGDGLQNIALVHDGSIAYWPNLGHGNWGKQVQMKHCPRFPYGYDPKRILVGDVDGDGLADIVYVEDTRVTLWINQSGNGWSDPITIQGTPPVADMDAVRIVDVLGSGIGGILWSRDAGGLSRDHYYFLDFTGGLKSYLLNEMDNHIGAVTTVTYASSTAFYLKDQKRSETRWKTTLPFPVHVVSNVAVTDYFSKGRLTTEYRYHHGYWDGAEREFRGFGMVEQRDSEEAIVATTDRKYFSPPTLRKTWFHQGPVGDEDGHWRELDRSDEYWPGDPQLLNHTESVNQFLQNWPTTPNGRRVKRDALRTLRGSMLRTELYALDGSGRQDRPYTVSESAYGLIEVFPPRADTKRLHIFLPHAVSQRTTQWERGDDPMTQCSFTRYTDENNANLFDPFGRPTAQTQIACPRGWRTLRDKTTEPYLATRTCSIYANPIDPKTYLHTRVAKSTQYEIVNTVGKRLTDIVTIKDSDADLILFGQTLSFYDGPACVGLPLGHVGPFGAATRTESLVLTDEILQMAYGTELPPYITPGNNPIWTSEYPQEFRSLLSHRAGYTFHSGSAGPADPTGYFVNTDRKRYDFQSGASGKGRGLMLEAIDPLYDATNPSGHRTLIAYDTFQFLPERVTDAAGLTVQAKNDYRVLQPGEVTDPNGNKSSFTFSPLGLVESIFIQGKSSTEGDQTRAGVRMEYGFLAFENSAPEDRQPIFVRSIRHVHHDTETDIPLPTRDETITTIEYSDGFGRLLQTRTQGEEVRFGDDHFGNGDDLTGRRNTHAIKPNVVVSGWQIYDNKGQVVEKYEPFFSEGWDYRQPDDSKMGQKVSMFYDPRGQTIRTLHADGSKQHVLYGVPGTIAAPDLEHPEFFEPTPWEAYTYDANDNAGRTHLAESLPYRHHWNTPASILTDALGRTVETIVRNRDLPADAGDPLPPMQDVRTRNTYDIRGNILTIVDALDRTAFIHVYDCANRGLRVDSIDAGSRKIIMDAAGGIVEQRDSKGALMLQGYDMLNRPVRLWARDGEGQRLTVRERLEYGDAGSPNQPAADRATHRAANRLGKLHQHFDEAGVLSFDAYDFKGNLLEKTRRVIHDAAVLEVFKGLTTAWAVDAFRVDWTTPATVSLDPTLYSTTVRFDAVGRVKHMTYPLDVENKRRRLTPHYNTGGALDRVTLEGSGVGSETFIERIAYNAKGQRILMAYGNGIMTRYAYDPLNFRLLHVRTENYTKPSDLVYRAAGKPQQDLGYAYDLTGNITVIHDRTPGSGIMNTPLGQDALDRAFTYDALYRLSSATGRECDRPPDIPWEDAPRSTDLTKTRGYTEQYIYDLAGNMGQLKHQANGAGDFTRDFALVATNNRLKTLTIGKTDFDYDYDVNGNMRTETTSRHFEWDYTDRLRVYRTQTSNSEPSVHAHYLYDAAGQRVKKLVRKQGGRVEVTVYIDGIFEYQRIVQGSAVEENNTLHMMDDESRIALVRVGNAFTGDATPAIKYTIGDHLGSSNLVIDSFGNLINREEYTPYGETSFGSFARKRYRYTGKERDEESGLNYHSARYYAPWLGRWASCDPAGPLDSENLYRFVQNNPILFVDPGGMQSESDSAIRPGETDPHYESNTLPDVSDPDSVGSATLSDMRVQADIPFEPSGKSAPGAVEKANGVGKVEAVDVVSFGKGAANSIAGWIAGPIASQLLPRFKVDNGLGTMLGGAVGDGLAGAAGEVAQGIGAIRVARAARISAAVSEEQGLSSVASRARGKLFDPAKLDRIKANLEKQNVTFRDDEAAVARLNEAKAEAMYDNTTNPGGPGTILLRPNPSQNAVIHELNHLGQHRATKWALDFNSSLGDKVKLEMATYIKLLRLRNVKWTLDEVMHMFKYWNYYRRLQ